MEIPLESGVTLGDPRGVTKSVPVPTPITDEDALMLERMLDEQPEPEPESELEPQPEPQPEQQPGPSKPVTNEATKEGNNSLQVLFSNLDDPDWAEKYIAQNPITQKDQTWLEELLQPATQQLITEKVRTPANQPTTTTTVRVPDPWADNKKMLTVSKKIPLITVPERSLIPPEPSNVTNMDRANNGPPPLKLNIRLPAPGERNPYDPALPEYLVKEAAIGRIPPWELYDNMRQTMGTIMHNGERYLVLDELESEEWQDLNEPLEEPRDID